MGSPVFVDRINTFFHTMKVMFVSDLQSHHYLPFLVFQRNVMNMRITASKPKTQTHVDNNALSLTSAALRLERGLPHFSVSG